jgi:hypothetical protein
MARSLKSCLPALAHALNESPDTLYERQRALVREGLLQSLPGRGRGSGVVASIESVAMLLIGLLASVSLSNAGPAARAIAKAAPAKKCPLTGAATFKDAVAQILSDKALAARVNVIRVAVTHGYAEILFDGSSSEISLRGLATNAKVTRAPENSVFVARLAKGPGLRIDVAIDAGTVRALAETVTELL